MERRQKGEQITQTFGLVCHARRLHELKSFEQIPKKHRRAAISRPKRSETEELVERIPRTEAPSLLQQEKAWGFDFQVIRIRPSFSVPPAPTAPHQSGLRPASFPEGEAFGNPVGLYTCLQALFLNLTGLLWVSSPTRFIGLFIEL